MLQEATTVHYSSYMKDSSGSQGLLSASNILCRVTLTDFDYDGEGGAEGGRCGGGGGLAQRQDIYIYFLYWKKKIGPVFHTR